MKYNKFVLSILASSLMITTSSAILNNSNHVEAKRYNGRGKSINSQEKKVVKVDYLSKEDTKKIIDSLESEGIITKEKQNELLAMLDDKSFGGWFWIETFSDNAKDIHIPGWFMASAAVGLGTLKGVAKAVEKGVSLIGKLKGGGFLWIANLAVSSFSWDAIKNGLVLYMVNPQTKLVCAGGNCYYDTIYEFHHMRIDY